VRESPSRRHCRVGATQEASAGRRHPGGESRARHHDGRVRQQLHAGASRACVVRDEEGHRDRLRQSHGRRPRLVRRQVRMPSCRPYPVAVGCMGVARSPCNRLGPQGRIGQQRAACTRGRAPSRSGA
jgi:hypothetical protein